MIFDFYSILFWFPFLFIFNFGIIIFFINYFLFLLKHSSIFYFALFHNNCQQLLKIFSELELESHLKSLNNLIISLSKLVAFRFINFDTDGPTEIFWSRVCIWQALLCYLQKS